MRPAWARRACCGAVPRRGAARARRLPPSPCRGAGAAPSRWQAGDPPPARFEVAENGLRFAFASAPVHDDGMPAYGNPFVTEGYLYPSGTLGGSNGVLPDGQPEFPEKVIGTWICRGYMIGDGAHTESGPWVTSTQTYNFGAAFGAITLITEGFELADKGVAVTRAVIGGTGPFRGAGASRFRPCGLHRPDGGQPARRPGRAAPLRRSRMKALGRQTTPQTARRAVGRRKALGTAAMLAGALGAACGQGQAAQGGGRGGGQAVGDDGRSGGPDRPGAAGGDSAVLRWNEAALAAIRATRPAPPVAARALAILHTAIFDAWAPFDVVAVGTAGASWGAVARRTASQRTAEHKRAAVSAAVSPGPAPPLSHPR